MNGHLTAWGNPAADRTRLTGHLIQIHSKTLGCFSFALFASSEHSPNLATHRQAQGEQNFTAHVRRHAQPDQPGFKATFAGRFGYGRIECARCHPGVFWHARDGDRRSFVGDVEDAEVMVGIEQIESGGRRWCARRCRNGEFLADVDFVFVLDLLIGGHERLNGGAMSLRQMSQRISGYDGHRAVRGWAWVLRHRIRDLVLLRGLLGLGCSFGLVGPLKLI